MAITDNIKLDQGATFTKTVVFKIDGTPVDLVAGGYTARLKARQGFDNVYVCQVSYTSPRGMPQEVQGYITLIK